ncbi:MAG: RluA family pseudouridine synthase [Patescibacteria group bacterium]
MRYDYQGLERERLDVFLHEQHPDVSRNQIKKFLETNQVSVNGKPASVHHWLKTGDVIEGPDLVIARRDREPRTTVEPSLIHHEATFVVVSKPAGLLTHPTEHDESRTLVSWLADRFPQSTRVGDDPQRPGIVHRLDKDVSGLLVAALTQDMFDHLKKQFKEHTVTKRYRCLVYGLVQQDDGIIDTPIERNRDKGRMVAQSGKDSGKAARTSYSVIKRFYNYTLLDVQILTGRTHQIRAHFHSIGHSIVGDQLYQTRDVRKKKIAARLLDRPFLFAYALAFNDLDGQRREFSLELPHDLADILRTLT